MSKLKLEKIAEELDRQTYDIRIRLSSWAFIHAERQSLADIPTIRLVLEDRTGEYEVPLSEGPFTLETTYSQLEEAVSDGSNIFAVAPDEVSQTLEAMKESKVISITVAVHEDPSDDDEARDERRREAIKDVRQMLESAIDERLPFLISLIDYFDQYAIDTALTYIRYAADENRDLIRRFDDMNDEAERSAYFADTSTDLKFVGKTLNAVLLGGFRRRLMKEIDTYAERNVAWIVLGQITGKISKNLAEKMSST